jgi:thiamine-phosphate pyrophosphorylase
MNPYKLYLVTDDQQDIQTVTRVVKEAVSGGVTAVQVREKHHDIRAFIHRARAIKEVLMGTNVPLIINDRVDVALAVEADGVHLGQSDMPVSVARKIVGSKMLIGLSVENEQQLKESQFLPIDYIGLSAIFATPTKTDTVKQWGISGLQNALKKSKLPIVAIGGINQSNIAKIASTGVEGIAIVSAISHSDDPKKSSETLLTLFQD